MDKCQPIMGREIYSKPWKNSKSNKSPTSLTRRVNYKLKFWLEEKYSQYQNLLCRIPNLLRELHKCKMSKSLYFKMYLLNTRFPTKSSVTTWIMFMFKTMKNKPLNNLEKLLSITCININLTVSRL